MKKNKKNGLADIPLSEISEYHLELLIPEILRVPELSDSERKRMIESSNSFATNGPSLSDEEYFQGLMDHQRYIAYYFIEGAKLEDRTMAYVTLEKLQQILVRVILMLECDGAIYDKSGNRFLYSPTDMLLLKHLGSCLMRISEGEDANVALNTNMKKGHSKPTEVNRERWAQEDRFRYLCAIAVEYGRSQRYSLHKAAMFVAEKAGIPDSEHTVISHYKKYKKHLPDDCKAHLEKYGACK